MEDRLAKRKAIKNYEWKSAKRKTRRKELGEGRKEREAKNKAIRKTNRERRDIETIYKSNYY